MKLQKMAVLFLLVSSVLLWACSEQQEVTGNAVYRASTLTIIARSENGTLMDGTQVFVNEKYKGVTARHGAGKGSLKVVLGGRDNLIRVEKSGYQPAAPTTVSASYKGDQVITFTLDPLQTGFLVYVREKEEPLQGATVSVQDAGSIVKEIITDEEGLATIGPLHDGNYTFIISKPGFLTQAISENLNYTEDGEAASARVVLEHLPYLTVTVGGAGDVPLEGAELTLYTEQEFNTPGGTAKHISRTRDDGKVFYEDVRSGDSYVVVAKKAGYKAQTIARTLSTEEDQSLQIVLEQES